HAGHPRRAPLRRPGLRDAVPPPQPAPAVVHAEHLRQPRARRPLLPAPQARPRGRASRTSRATPGLTPPLSSRLCPYILAKRPDGRRRSGDGAMGMIVAGAPVSFGVFELTPD